MDTPAIRIYLQHGGVERRHLGITAGILAGLVIVVFLLYPRPAPHPDNIPGVPSAPPVTGEERGDAARNIIARMQETEESGTTTEDSAPATEATAGVPAAVERVSQPEAEAEPLDRFEEAYRQAREFRDQGKLADAQLLYFFAARGGNAAAAFDLASSYDPLHFTPETSLMDKPDPFQAAKWYRAAAAQDIPGATDRLEALHAWADNAAAAGDEQAERLLLTWDSLE